MDILQNEFLLNQKVMFFDRVIKNIEPLEWDMKSSKTHITVGCFKNVTSNVVREVSCYKEFPVCTINKIGVSLAGKRGVCLGTLKSLTLPENKDHNNNDIFYDK